MFESITSDHPVVIERKVGPNRKSLMYFKHPFLTGIIMFALSLRGRVCRMLTLASCAQMFFLVAKHKQFLAGLAFNQS